MRKIISWTAATAFFALALPVHSQDNGTANQANALGFAKMLNGVNPRNIPVTMPNAPPGVPVDTTKALQMLNTSNALRPPTQTKAFSFTNMFPKISLPSFPSKQASTPILPSSPFQSVASQASK